MTRVVLASASPRRRELLKRLNITELLVSPATAEEEPCPGLGPEETVLRLSRQKALEVSARVGRSELVVAADTIVFLKGEKLGKPKDEAEARRMLTALSGERHTVYTGVTVIGPGGELSQAEATEVFFRPISGRELDAYIASGEPLDKAGGYGIQGLGALFIERIEGDFFNVMGLPLCRLGKMLGQIGVELI